MVFKNDPKLEQAAQFPADMIRLLRTDAMHPDFTALVQLLDAELAERDGDDHSFYAAFNKSDHLRHVVIGYHQNVPVACGAFRPYDQDSVEVKRMYTMVARRGQRFAGSILAELELWAGELGYSRCVLETGKNQPEAIALYNRQGYTLISNYGPYVGVENSVCFEKRLKAGLL